MNYLNYTKKIQFCMWQYYIFPKTRKNKNKQCTHSTPLKNNEKQKKFEHKITSLAKWPKCKYNFVAFPWQFDLIPLLCLLLGDLIQVRFLVYTSVTESCRQILVRIEYEMYIIETHIASVDQFLVSVEVLVSWDFELVLLLDLDRKVRIINFQQIVTATKW